MDIQEVVKQMKILEEKAEKYDSIKEFMDKKVKAIDEKINEIKVILNDFNPQIVIGKRLYRRANIINEIHRKVVLFLRENKNKCFSASELAIKFEIDNGGSMSKLTKYLRKNKDIKVEQDPNRLSALQISYVGEIIKSEAIITEKVKKDAIVGDGIKMPRKSTYMG